LAARINGHGTQPPEPKRVPPRPPRGTIDWDSVLGFLIASPQWLLWRYELFNDQWTKPPYQPNRRNGSSIDPRTWSDWESIQVAFESDTDGDRFFDGIGFALTADLELIGFDFDHCYDSAIDVTDPTIARFLTILNSATEITPGGDGFRVFTFGTLPRSGRKRGGFPKPGMACECYSDGRYLTVTGHRFGEATEIIANQAGIDEIHTEIFAERIAKQSSVQTNRYSADASLNIPDEELLERARKATNGDRFAALYDRGDWQGQGFPSQSEADLALCNLLAFWTGRDSERIDRLLRSSGLMRPKWTRSGYAIRTVAEAIASSTEIYGGRKATLNGDDAKDPSHESVKDDVSTAPEPEPPVKHSDIAISNRYSDRHVIDLRFVNQHNVWLNYSRNYWKPDQLLFHYTLAKRLLTELANEAYREMTEAAVREKDVESERIRKAARALATSLTSSDKVYAVVTLTRSHPKIAATQEQFDRDNWLLNTPLGAVKLRTGEIREHRRDDYCTKITSVGPVEMDTPKFDKFLRQIMGSEIPPEACKCAACVASVNEPNMEIRQALHDAEVEALVEYLWRLYGYCLTGDVRAHILVVEIGEGGNGKGVLNDFMSVHIFGQRARDGYSCEMPMEALIAPKGGDRHPTELMDLWHSRLAIARESEEDTRWNEGRVKKLSGGDPIKARHMRQDFVEFDATHKLIVFGQVKPTLRGASQAAWLRRLHLIPFPQRFAHVADPTKHVLAANPSLIDELATEAPGVLFKLLAALGRYLKKRDFKMPATVAAASRDYLFSQDIVGQWLADCCDTTNPNERSTLKELWVSWQPWAEKHNEWVGKRAEFREALERAGIRFSNERNTRNVAIGVKLISA
jgi:putative DNA primase/helicase